MLRAATALALVLLLVPRARATIVEAYDLARLKESAARVALVRAGTPTVRQDARGRRITDVPLEVEEAIVGAPDAFVLTVFGGQQDGVGMVTAGEPVLREGRRYVVFARAWQDDGVERFRPVGMSQGVLEIRGAGGRATVLPGGAGLTLVPSPDDPLRAAEPALRAAEDLDGFLVRLRALP
ncbi:MAG: hypothetical protein AAGH15_08135 [Myxococcota bacterium]